MRPAESAVSKDVVKFLIDHEASFVFGMTMVSYMSALELTDSGLRRVKTAGSFPLWGPRTTLALDPRPGRRRLDRTTERRPQHRHPLHRSDGGDLARTCGQTRRHEARAGRPSSGERAETATRRRLSTRPPELAASRSRLLFRNTLSRATMRSHSRARFLARRSARTWVRPHRRSRSAVCRRARVPSRQERH